MSEDSRYDDHFAWVYALPGKTVVRYGYLPCFYRDVSGADTGWGVLEDGDEIYTGSPPDANIALVKDRFRYKKHGPDSDEDSDYDRDDISLAGDYDHMCGETHEMFEYYEDWYPGTGHTDELEREVIDYQYAEKARERLKKWARSVRTAPIVKFWKKISVGKPRQLWKCRLTFPTSVNSCRAQLSLRHPVGKLTLTTSTAQINRVKRTDQGGHFSFFVSVPSDFGPKPPVVAAVMINGCASTYVHVWETTNQIPPNTFLVPRLIAKDTTNTRKRIRDEPQQEEPVPKLTRAQQLESYCGSVPELINHARDKFSTTGGMSTTAVRKWYLKNTEFIPEWLRDKEWTVDHIISDHIGGYPYPYNYFLMPKSDNSSFGKWATKQKECYVGRKAFEDASAFARWCRIYSLRRIDFGKFDPISACMLGRA